MTGSNPCLGSVQGSFARPAIHARFWLAGSLLFAIPAASPAAETGPRLEIFTDEQPVCFFFRGTEATARKRAMSYEEWEARFSRLNGVMGKMLDEEVLGASATQEYYRRFKKDHPDQAVLLHANGCFRKPLADLSAYHDGHWLYYNGARVLDDVPATAADTTLRVSDVSVFALNPHRGNPSIPEDVGLCRLGSDGRPDWNHAEQVRLKAIDAERGTIVVERCWRIPAPRRRNSTSQGSSPAARCVD